MTYRHYWTVFDTRRLCSSCISTCASLLHPNVVEILMTLMLKGVLHFYSQGSRCIEFKNLFSASNSFSYFYIIQVYILKYFCIISLHSQIFDITRQVMFNIIVLWTYWGLPYSFASFSLSDCVNLVSLMCMSRNLFVRILSPWMSPP